MGLFRRESPAASDQHPVTAFWTWWAAEGHSIDPHKVSPATDELTYRVGAIHPDLTWHFGPGTTSQHRLTVSAGGIAEIRPTAERWLRAAPPASATWEFRSSQQPDPNALSNTLEIAGHKIDLSATAFGVNPVDEELRVHVGTYHPVFKQLSKQVQTQITYFVLDWLLGEDDVERWLGHIEPLNAPPETAGSAADLRGAVDAIAAQRDADEWVLAQWEDEDGTPGLAAFRRGLRWIDYPTLDCHQIISATYTAQENGLPADAPSLDALRDIESDLESFLGARGVLVAHETCRGSRSFHVYTDGEDPNVDTTIHDWVNTRRLSVEARPDPAWSQVRHFTG